MDPLHITEFASPRYFDKLRSLSEAAENADPNPNPPAEPSNGPSQTNTLTLPIGNLARPLAHRRRRSDDNVRPSDRKRSVLGHDLTPLQTERRPNLASFASIRSKISGGHKIPSTYVDHDEYIPDEESTRPQ